MADADATAPGALLNLRFPAEPCRLRDVRERIQALCEDIGCSTKPIAELVLAVNEACMNIMQHAYKGDPTGIIVLEVRRDGPDLEITIKDFAEPVAHGEIAPRALHELRPGGLGTHFIQATVDDCSYGHLADRAGNFVKMRKRIR
ncbi:MAG: ATP-binding protein [Gammaproteobacteria bacterium]